MDIGLKAENSPVIKNPEFLASRMVNTTLHSSHILIQFGFLANANEFYVYAYVQTVRNEHFERNLSILRFNVHSTCYIMHFLKKLNLITRTGTNAS